MLIVFAALIGLGLACINLPEPMVSHLASGIVEVSFEDVPGTQFSEIAYSNNENMESSEVGQLHQAADGRWYHRNNSAVQIDGQPFYYKVSALINGKKVDYSGVVSSENTTTLAPLQRVSKRGTVIFRDNFDGSALNQAEWEHEVSMYGGYNWEIQVYTNDPLNVFQQGGKLYLKPTQTSDKFGEEFLTNGTMDVTEIWGTCTNSDRYGCVREGKNGLLPPIMSGKVKSKKTIKFGRVDVRAKIPKGDWIWPAIWLLPRSYSYGGWPASGEIDMMEARGNLRAKTGCNNHGVGEIGSTLHWGPEPSQNRFFCTHGEKDDPTLGWSREFHTYTLDWDADRIIFT